MEAMLPRLPQRPLRQVLPQVTPARGETKYQVGFFLGCAQSLLFAEESAATVRVLSRNGCTSSRPARSNAAACRRTVTAGSTWCGQQAKHNIAVFEQTEVGCNRHRLRHLRSTLKEYGAYLKDDPEWADRAEAFSRKVRDVSEFLAEIPLEKPQGRIEARVTYHDPCHLRRAQKVWKQPRDLLKLIDGLEFVELPEADWCCGSAAASSSPITRHRSRSWIAKWTIWQARRPGHCIRLPRLPDAVEHRYPTARAECAGCPPNYPVR